MEEQDSPYISKQSLQLHFSFTTAFPGFNQSLWQHEHLDAFASE